MKDDRNVPALRPSKAHGAATPVLRRERVRDYVLSSSGAFLLAISLASSLLGALSTGLPYVGFAILGVSLTILTALVVFSLVTSEREITKEARRAYDERLKLARSRFDALIKELGPSEDSRRQALILGAKALVRDGDAAAIADDMVLRLEDLHNAYEKATADAGRSDTTAIREHAARAVESICDDACARHADLVRQLEARDDMRIDDVTRRFAETARSVAGLPHIPQALPPHSATAALQRLVGLGEDALAVDPDLVDGTGARLDALVRDHLPNLLRIHANAARSPSSDLAKVDAELEKGLEEIRSGVEDALARDAQRRFDLLVDQVAFLRMRRQT